MKNTKMKVFKGEHCETTALGTLLLNLGLELSEPMIFGIGESLSYGAMKFGSTKFPFIGGRIRTGFITKNLCKNLGLTLNTKKTSSIKKAWTKVANLFDQIAETKDRKYVIEAGEILKDIAYKEYEAMQLIVNI